MRKLKKRIVEVVEDDGNEGGAVVQIEVDKPFIEFYKKETGRSRVSSKGLSHFIQHLIDSHRMKD